MPEVMFASACSGSTKCIVVKQKCRHTIATNDISKLPISNTEQFFNFGQWVVVRWLCVSVRYSFVERAEPTLCMRCHSLCASGLLCMHKNVRGARSTKVLTRRTPAMRRARWTNAGPTPDTRGAHAGYALYVRRLGAVAGIRARLQESGVKAFPTD